ncbi:MAG: bifunctional adenosylcobinamide kinase/adenosylcobinamide-phosphate guanylyltransferase [Nitrospirota bacterium]|nr:bifunctional adenosylcobinamide kinase/adenosylcobinamide-phosphate guanylyltransferase [Nitrospirota bacterium]
MSRKLVFITGGARSGKSTFALKEASKISGNKAYIATAEALDEEMKERIEKHKKQRGNGWDTYEEPIKISEVIKKIEGKCNVIVIDCLTLWLSNLMHAGSPITDEINNLIDVLTNVGAWHGMPHCRGGSRTAPTIFIVSNEVGMGIVPDNELARNFRDMAGILNQKIAEIADEVYMVVAGIPIRVK